MRACVCECVRECVCYVCVTCVTCVLCVRGYTLHTRTHRLHTHMTRTLAMAPMPSRRNMYLITLIHTGHTHTQHTHATYSRNTLTHTHATYTHTHSTHTHNNKKSQCYHQGLCTNVYFIRACLFRTNVFVYLSAGDCVVWQ